MVPWFWLYRPRAKAGSDALTLQACPVFDRTKRNDTLKSFDDFT